MFDYVLRGLVIVRRKLITPKRKQAGAPRERRKALERSPGFGGLHG